MKILLSTYACHPTRGSEQGVGWHWLKELSKVHEVWAIIYDGQGQREAVESAICNLPHKTNIHLIPLAVPSYFRERLYRIRYELWNRIAHRVAQELTKSVSFDLTHQVTIATWWNCGFLWKLGIPFVLGPISGAQYVPLEGISLLPLKGIISELIRNILAFTAWKTLQNPRQGIAKASLVFCANYETFKIVNSFRKGKNVVILTEIGAELPEKTNPYDFHETINLLWSGRMISLKNFGTIARVLDLIRHDRRIRLRVAGEGPLMKKWQQVIEKLDLLDSVEFLGAVPYQQMGDHYRWADIFVFPSLREATGTVILEAMSYGIPVVAFKIHGADVVLDCETGVLVPVITSKQMVDDFAEAVLTLANDQNLRKKLGKNAREKVETELSWKIRGNIMTDYYMQILKDRDDPAF